MLHILLILLLTALSGCVSSGNEAENQILADVKKRDFSIDLHIIGVLDAAKSHMISSGIEGANGKIIYLIDDGERVEKGVTLVRFDRALFEKEVAELESLVESYSAAVKAAEQVVAFEINQVRREVVSARYGESVAALELKRLQEGDGPLKLSVLKEEQQKVEIELKRYQSFLLELESFQEKGFENPSEVSSTKEKVAAYTRELASVNKRYKTYEKHVLPALIESGRAKVQNAASVLQQTEQGGKYKVAKVNASLLQVKGILQTKKSALAKARFKLAQTEITAPFAGIVIHYKTFRNGEKRKPREGDSVFMNQPILYLPDVSKMMIKTQAREVDLHKVKLGQEGRIVVDAYPDAQLTGELTFIGSLATVEDSRKSFEKYFQVLFKVNEEDDRLRPGMTCRISIQVESLKDTISVPVQAVFMDEKNSFCYVKTRKGGFEVRTVIPGRHNIEFVEILEGLKGGEQVSLIKQEI
jgi:HlyD family secretion protein